MKLGKYIRIMVTVLFVLFGLAFQSYAGNISGTISSVKIDSQNKDLIQVDASLDITPLNQEREVYLFELQPYQHSIDVPMNPLASSPVLSNLKFSVSLKKENQDTRLYSAFCLAIREAGQYKIISNKHYITNPELIAPNQSEALNRGIKGLGVDSDYQEAIALGIKHAGINIATKDIFGKGITYSYKGKNYNINASTLLSLDTQIKAYSDAGVAVTAVIVNAWNTEQPELNLPGLTQLPSEQALYYQFNTSSKKAVDSLEALASFLAKRYNGQNGYGKITNWVIGNEINNQRWNHANVNDEGQYIQDFQDAFRIFYTAIKSESANDNVMFSIDHYWNIPTEAQATTTYSGKSIVDTFAYINQAEGAIDWGLALHPYPYPMNSPMFWKERDERYGVSSYFSDSVDSPIVDFVNLHVVTDYMQSPGLLDTNGKVRTIFLTEEGFSSVTGSGDMATQQAAAIAYSYYIAANNPYIKAYILSRQEDHEEELKSGLAVGLSVKYEDGKRVDKPAKEVFRLIDTEQSKAVSEFAKTVVGVTEREELIPGFRYP